MVLMHTINRLISKNHTPVVHIRKLNLVQAEFSNINGYDVAKSCFNRIVECWISLEACEFTLTFHSLHPYFHYHCISCWLFFCDQQSSWNLSLYFMSIKISKISCIFLGIKLACLHYLYYCATYGTGLE